MNRPPDSALEFVIFALLCFAALALIWAAWWLATSWLESFKRSLARQEYDRGYIFAMQALRAKTYSSSELLSMSYGLNTGEFDRGVREGVRSYEGYGELNSLLEEALIAAREKQNEQRSTH